MLTKSRKILGWVLLLPIIISFSSFVDLYQELILGYDLLKIALSFIVVPVAVMTVIMTMFGFHRITTAEQFSLGGFSKMTPREDPNRQHAFIFLASIVMLFILGIVLIPIAGIFTTNPTIPITFKWIYYICAGFTLTIDIYGWYRLAME